MTVDEMVEEQMTAEPTVFTNGVFPASEENVEQYVNPENLVSGYEKYQFMDLSVSNNVDSATLDTYLRVRRFWTVTAVNSRKRLMITM